MAAPTRALSRFQVMATLQAARAVALGLTLDEAKSWGLNRALFYAAAKNAWANAKAIGARYPVIPEFEEARQQRAPVYVLGGEKAFRARDYRQGLRFKFGDRVQTPEEFDRKIIARFPDWERAWGEALQIIDSADRRDLDIQHRFFDRVYKPRRDTLARRWSAMSGRDRRAA
jgi:hypothetical protein